MSFDKMSMIFKFNVELLIPFLNQVKTCNFNYIFPNQLNDYRTFEIHKNNQLHSLQ